jgi:hypothetical protein
MFLSPAGGPDPAPDETTGKVSTVDEQSELDRLKIRCGQLEADNERLRATSRALREEIDEMVEAMRRILVSAQGVDEGVPASSHSPKGQSLN